MLLRRSCLVTLLCAVASIALACGSDHDSSGSGGAAGASGGSAGGGALAGGAGISAGNAGQGGTSLASLLEADGFSVQAGSFELLEIGDCCSVGKSCSGNNPASPYAAFFLPPGPGQTIANPAARPDGTSLAYRLRSDEAIVYVGTTPPQASYFGFTPYLYDRDTGAAARKTIFASLSETLNNGVIAVDGSGDVFEKPTVVVVASDQSTDSRVRTSIAKAGYAAASINTIVIDAAKAKLGLEETADTFGVLFRVALFEDQTAGDAYLASLPGSVLRVTPNDVSAPSPLPSPLARPKDLEHGEAALESAVDELQAAVIAANPGATASPLLVNQGLLDADTCIQNAQFCAGDNRDTIYPSIAPRSLFASADDFYVVLGVNHAATGKATYSSFSVYAVEHLVGVASVTSRQFAGSANDFLPNNPDASKLYAWKIARQCGTDPHCLAIPDAGCPTGVQGAKLGLVAFRAYLEPTTNTAPDPSTLVIDRVIRFAK